MKLKRMTAGLALAMSLAMSVSALADGSITGVIENPEIVVNEDTELVGAKTLEIVEEFEASYFSTTEEGIEAKKTFDEMNDGTKSIAEAIPELKKDEDVTVDVEDLAMLTPMMAVVIRDQDGNIIENGKNVSISFELTNIPDNTDIFALLYDATNGYSLHKLKSGSVLGDSIIGEGAEAYTAPTVKAGAVLADVERGTLNGNLVTLTFGDVKGAAFSILYKKVEGSTGSGSNGTAGSIDGNGATGSNGTNDGLTGGNTGITTPGADDNTSANTGNVGALPIALAAVVAGSAVIVSRKKRA
jgi:hypothetical protein